MLRKMYQSSELFKYVLVKMKKCILPNIVQVLIFCVALCSIKMLFTTNEREEKDLGKLGTWS